MDSPLHTQQLKRGRVSISPSHTPRSNDKAARSGDGNWSRPDKGVNVQVLVRCRPLSESEMRVNTPVVISCNETRGEVSAIQNMGNKQIERTFSFDRVFGPTSEQKDLYEQAVSPIVYEVLEGYNCTIFAYGQTGTGKTYTMEGGGKKAKDGEFPNDAGVIPRTVRHIFEILEVQNAEYSLKVTFLELYNEEIMDLLAPEDCSKLIDDKSKKPIALMEDGKGGVLLRGLEEEIVTTANEIYKILERGCARRRTAETLLNQQSSRSHSIFSITIQIKECTPSGEEMIKCGKLNLVDLAGSENISRSGAREGRAREAGEINKSLLTLGRVINTLVEHSCHIPYRDSKLTRLLRDSLGGKTKTCIIATISPSIHCFEETLNTLDYAHRAKNIKNKPEVNQKMAKSTVIKDLYTEIDRLKQEVYAAREKNGIYVPRDRYLQEEAEKKAMILKIECMELDAESKDKQLLGLQERYTSQQLLTTELSEKLDKSQERYTSQQLLTTELSEKLDKSQKKLEETEYALVNLEESYEQANSKIREKEFVISNLFISEKALTERAFDLRTELESAASDISGLFAKIDRKDRIEDGNRIVIQKFQSQLSQQLEFLHKTVAATVMQQEHQLNELEEHMQSFASGKTKATKELQSQLGTLKTMHGSGIKALEDLAEKLVGNSESTVENLNAEVSKHSSALEDLFKRTTLEADIVLKKLQDSLSNQEANLAAYAQQQREGHSRTIETTRCISKITENFFKTLDLHGAKLFQIVEEAQTIHDKKLMELEKQFEECAANEERDLLEKVAELLASSSNRKKHLVQTSVNDLRKSALSRTSRLHQEVSTMQDFTSTAKDELTSYMEKTEIYYREDTAEAESRNNSLEEGIQHCTTRAKMSAQQWRNAQESLLNLENDNVASVESIVRNGVETNQRLCVQLSSAASSVLEDVEAANKSLLSSIEHSLKLDNEACGNIDSMIGPCCEELQKLKSNHYHKIVEITDDTEKCLEHEYTVDEPSCSTPRRRSFNLPTMASIEELRTPNFELLKSFWDTKSVKHSNGDLKHISGVYEAAQSLRDPRAPLVALN